MIGLAPAGTMPPASAQLGIERVQDVGVYLADLEVAQERRDVVAHVAAVERECVRRAVELVGAERKAQAARDRMVNSPLAITAPASIYLLVNVGAGGRDRTDDLPLTR
jgi:hypothetical protein